MIGMILCGLLLGILAGYILHRANNTLTRRALAGIGAQTATERAGGLVLDRGASLPAHTKYQAVTPSKALTGLSGRPFADVATLRHYVDRGHDGPLVDADFREYASSVPRIERGKTTVRHYKRNRLGPGGGAVAAVEITHSTPHREPNPGADLLVPLGQAVASAVIAALLAGVLAALAGRADTLRIVGGVFVIVLAGAWLWRLGVVDSLLSVVERVTQELDDDEPEPDEPTHLMAVQPDAARQTVATETRQRVYDERLAWLVGFVTRCYTVGTSESAQGIKPGERAKYLEARDLLLRLGLAEWHDEANKRLGWQMTTNQAMTVKTLREHVTAV